MCEVHTGVCTGKVVKANIVVKSSCIRRVLGGIVILYT